MMMYVCNVMILAHLQVSSIFLLMYSIFISIQIASGSWDSSIKLWSVLDDDDEIEDEAAKKRKLNGAGVALNHAEAQVSCIHDTYTSDCSTDHLLSSAY